MELAQSHRQRRSHTPTSTANRTPTLSHMHAHQSHYSPKDHCHRRQRKDADEQVNLHHARELGNLNVHDACRDAVFNPPKRVATPLQRAFVVTAENGCYQQVIGSHNEQKCAGIVPVDMYETKNLSGQSFSSPTLTTFARRLHVPTCIHIRRAACPLSTTTNMLCGCASNVPNHRIALFFQCGRPLILRTDTRRPTRTSHVGQT